MYMLTVDRHPHERGDSWLHTLLITGAIAGPWVQVQSMRPEEYTAYREEQNARKRKARGDHAAYGMRLPEYALDEDMPSLKRPCPVKCWCLRRFCCVVKASGKAWDRVRKMWGTSVAQLKASLPLSEPVLPIREPLPVKQEFQW